MESFEDITGQEEIVDYCRRTIEGGKLSHALMINGENNTGKEYIARIYASTIQCEKHGLKPCGECHSCRMSSSMNHPDVITVTHEKPNLISVDEIRDQINNDVVIKPYYSERKIYIIPDASMMNEAAQNALLKTLEEPPAYVMLILLVSNREKMLPTILSRCITLNIKPVSAEAIRKYLTARGISGRTLDMAAAYARGSIGRAEKMLSSQEEADIAGDVLDLMSRVGNLSVAEELDFVKKIADNKDDLSEYLEMMEAWYRDALYLKSTGDTGGLLFINEERAISEAARTVGYQKLSGILEQIQLTRERLNANGNLQACFGLLLGMMRNSAQR